MSARGVLYGLLGVVAAAAAVLSFAALRDLALVCGFAPWLAWLLPVVVDAGAAAGSLVWLGGWTADAARRFARALALALLGLSVAANALGHGLAAFALAPAWWVVVIVSAVAPAVLGAVVHLAVLVGRPDTNPPHTAAAAGVRADPDGAGLVRGDGQRWEPMPGLPGLLQPVTAAAAGPVTAQERADVLIAEGAGRRRLARELDISEYEARRLLDERRTPADQVEAGTGTEHDRTQQVSTQQVSTGQGQDVGPERVHAVNGAGRFDAGQVEEERS